MTDRAAATLLLVDDDDLVLLTLRDYLKAVGYRILEATNGADALAILERDDVDVVITDVYMPVKSGLQLLAIAIERFPAVPVILITGKPLLSAAVDCMRLGAADFIVKPFDLQKMRDAVVAALEQRERRRPAVAASPPWLPARYQYLQTIGKGNMGSVHLARDTWPPGELYAIKTVDAADVRPDLRPQIIQRFAHEVRAGSMVQHPNIVRILDHGLAPDQLSAYVVMERIIGQPLSFLIRHQTLNLGQKLSILGQIAAALAAIHAVGICHRDIKPANILVTPELLCKLTDFGIARLPDSRLTAVGQVLGSPAYMAPECFAFARSSPQADLFSFGVVAWELLHGQRLFAGKSLAETMHLVCREEPVPMARIAPDLPERLRQLVYRCLQRNPAQRWPTASEVADELAAVAADYPWESPPGSAV